MIIAWETLDFRKLKIERKKSENTKKINSRYTKLAFLFEAAPVIGNFKTLDIDFCNCV